MANQQSSHEVTFHRWYPVVGFLVAVSLGLLAVYHSYQLSIPAWRIPVILVSFSWLAITIIAAHFNRAFRGPIPELKVGVFIPSLNEDPAMLKAMLQSLDDQTKLPSAVYFGENGPTNGEAERVFRAWAKRTVIPHVEFVYRQKPGKRGAQIVTFVRNLNGEHAVDVICTVDSDTLLDPKAIAEGIKPFNDSEVMSVAGLLIGKNRSANMLARIVDLGFVASFMNGRAAWSSFGSVAVNCGGLAFYRPQVILKHLEEYRTQTLFGKPVQSGDDRMLTAYAALEGRTVFQQSSVGYTLLPVNISHLTRQRGRWWRTFWFEGIWLLRRFNPTRAIWWLVLSQYITFVLYAVMFPLILIYDPITHHKVPWAFFAYIGGLSYLRLARTLAIRRPDQSLRDQLLSFLLLSPMVTLLNLWLCTALQWWGLFTFYITGWGTRKKVEVGLDDQ